MRIAIAAALLFALPAAAQETSANPPESRADRFMRNCEDYGDRRREAHCEVRDQTLRPPSRPLSLDAAENGSVRVYGWDRNEVLVRALVHANAESLAEAREIAREIRITSENDRVRADGPSYRRRTGWYVSFEVWVPRKTSVTAETVNGSVSAQGVEGRIDLRAVNGSITVRELSGDVRGETSNGSVNAELDGTTWRGKGLDLRTSNGSVNLTIPTGYNAQLETGTVNGGMNIDFPITVRGFIGRRITTTLGSGGPRVRAVTTNGSVRIRQR